MAVESVVEQKPEEKKEPKLSLPVGIDKDILFNVMDALDKQPMRSKDLTAITKYGEDKNLQYLNYLMDKGIVNRLPKSDKQYWYERIGAKYEYDLSPEVPIKQIPEFKFTEIPIIQKWFELRGHHPAQRQAIKDFQNICYGYTVPGFTINPGKWQYPQTNELLYRAFKRANPNLATFSPNVVKALRSFLQACLRVQIQPKSYEAKLLGLTVVVKNAGKYRYTKLTKEQFQKAIEFLESSQCKEMCEKVLFTTDRIQAHFAFATEGFGRPSRVLTIESEKIERRLDGDRKILEWRQLETKQDREYPKLLKDQKLYQWAVAWADKRLFANYKYLFVDDNNYVVEKYDSKNLYRERRKYIEIYKEMFRYVGLLKEVDSIYNNDTLYSLRHIGVKRWVDRLGFAGIVVIKEMGWEDINTLIKFYAGLESVDVRNFIMAGNYKGTDFDLGT